MHAGTWHKSVLSLVSIGYNFLVLFHIVFSFSIIVVIAAMFGE